LNIRRASFPLVSSFINLHEIKNQRWVNFKEWQSGAASKNC
jgi:hypothetical protein